MTHSVDARRANLNEALIAFLNGLGDGHLCFFTINPTDYPIVLQTTWPELTSRFLLKDMDMNPQMFELTPAGYVMALQLSGRSNDPQFRERLGRLCRVLKGTLKDRTDSGLITLEDLLKESGVPEAFAHNAIEADLIRHILGRIGAVWEGERVVRVPRDFGLTPI
jgi:hypothetical protein